MYLVVVSGAFGDIPTRLFGNSNKAKLHVKSKWDSVKNEATEELYKEAWEASKSANMPAISEITGVRVLRFRDGVMVGCVCNISGRVKSGNMG